MQYNIEEKILKFLHPPSLKLVTARYKNEDLLLQEMEGRSCMFQLVRRQSSGRTLRSKPFVFPRQS